MCSSHSAGDGSKVGFEAVSIAFRGVTLLPRSLVCVPVFHVIGIRRATAAVAGPELGATLHALSPVASSGAAARCTGDEPSHGPANSSSTR
jgi:hypothetical protein